LVDGGAVTTVVALGGNTLTRAGERGTIGEQSANVRATCAAIRPLFEPGEPVVVTHGNGPQAGNALLRHERAAAEAPAHPLWLIVAETQAQIGALIVTELTAVAQRPAVCLLTRVAVDPGDPAFDVPTKPIGPFYSRDESRALQLERGWRMVEDAGRGFRRAVPSPRPVAVLEAQEIGALLACGAVPVCCGGGGIPVDLRSGHGGLDAVIDKDFTSALLARQLRADRLVVLTDVPALARGFDTPEAEEVRELTVVEAEALAPELAAGSMRPKIEAAAEFVRATGGEALITCASALERALSGLAGTRLAR
jgi:carbamate kinase